MSKKRLATRCNAQQMMKVIIRQSPMVADAIQPEHKLIFAIIGSAVADLLDLAQRGGAEYFFSHDGFDNYCNLVGLNAKACCNLLVHGGFLERAA